MSDPALIRSLLVEQITGTVRWRESVLAMKGAGIDEMVEIGVGKVLTGLAKRIDRSLATASLHTPDEIAAFVAAAFPEPEMARAVAGRLA